MIEAVASNEIKEARKYAYKSLEEDGTQKNKNFVERYKKILLSKENELYELPRNVEGILEAENVKNTFKRNRYFLTEQQKMISNQILKMNKVSKKLMEMEIPYKNTTLLFGVPGVGKTTFGRYIAYKLNIPFIYLNFSKVVDSYMGGTSKNISTAFSYAKTNPCVFMLDEVDAISCNRRTDSSSGGRENARMTVTLMQELDRLPNYVILIAATNRIDMLDSTFISRCSLKCEIKPFTKEENIMMVKKYLSSVDISLSKKEIDELSYLKDQRTIMNELIRKIAMKIEY